MLKVLDLFSGACGGWSKGLHNVGFNTVAACERDGWRQQQFLRNFPHAKMYSDVRAITAAGLRSDGISVDFVCGSPPCQDASTANTKGKGIDGERTGLYLEAVRIVLEVRPRWFAFENVPGIRNRGIDRVLSLLEEGGYSAWPVVVGACDLGAPHIRKRSIVIGADAETVQRLALPWDQPDRNSERIVANSACDGRGSRRPWRFDSSAEGQQGDFNALASDTKGSGGRSGLCKARPFSDGPVASDGPGASSNANSDGIRQQLRRRSRTDGAEEASEPEGCIAGQSRGAGLEIIGSKPGYDGPKLSPLERAITARCGARAENWNGGIAGRIGVDAWLPKGMARPLLAAYGDAFAPQEAELVGKAIVNFEKTLRAM